MEDALLIAFGIATVVLAALWLRTIGQNRVLKTQLENCKTELAEERREVFSLATAVAALRTEIDEKEKAHAKEIEGLTAVSVTIDGPSPIEHGVRPLMPNRDIRLPTTETKAQAARRQGRT